MKTKTLTIGIGCLVFAVLLLFGGAALAFLMLVPDVPQQLSPGTPTLIVTVSEPLNGTRVPLNQFTHVSAEALGVKPITALELWIDGTPSETKSAPAGSTLGQFSAFWTWTPAGEGEHTLLVRAVDADHNTGMSNIVRVTASKDANVVPGAVIQTKPGDTASSLAQKIKVSPQQIIDLNPQVSASGTITPGEMITVPIPTPPPSETPEPQPTAPPEPPGDPNQPPANKGPNKYQVWWNKNILKQFGLIKPAAAPGLAASVGAGKCAIDLYIYDKSDNEDGFFLYRLDPNTFSFMRIATLDAHNGAQPIHYIDPAATGKYQYYVSAFNAWGESPSKIVQTGIIEPCGSPQSSLQLENAKMTVKQPVDQVYCYLQVDDGPWTRIPPDPNTFIKPTKPGEFDVSQYLKSLTPSPAPVKITLRLECWGWKGDTLIYLGEATETLGQGPVKVISPNWELIGNLLPQMKPLSGGGGGGGGDPNIAPPYNVGITTDVQECNARYDPTWCGDLISSGVKVLIWDWQPNPCPSQHNCVQDIDGYNVYMIKTGEPPTLLRKIANRNIKATLFSPPHAESYQVFVRAYKGMSESNSSTQVSIEKATRKSIPLTPSDSLSRRIYSYENCGHWYGGLNTWGGSSDGYSGHPGLKVGYFHTNSEVAPCDFDNTVYRTAVRFDLSKVSLPIADARLTFEWSEGIYRPAYDVATNEKVSCVRKLLLATHDWRGDPWGNQPIQIPGEPYRDNLTPYALPPAYDINVTDAVRAWLQGARPNYGFVLAGPNDFVNSDYGTDACASIYRNFVLEITTLAP